MPCEHDYVFDVCGYRAGGFCGRWGGVGGWEGGEVGVGEVEGEGGGVVAGLAVEGGVGGFG